MSSRTRALLFSVFLLSGAAGLVYEIAWVRRLATVFGSTTLAVSTVLAAFMGGLALGSLAIGRYADRDISKGRAVRVYGLLEVGIALYAVAIPWLFRAIEAAYLPLGPALAESPRAFFGVQFALVAAVLVVPTAMMGGTLPLLSRAFVDRNGEISRRIGGLYSANTIGAALGAAAATYSLLPFTGLRQTELAAAAASAAAGLIAISIGRRLSPPEVEALSDADASAVSSAVALPKAEASAEAGALAKAKALSRVIPAPLSREAKTLLAGIALSGFAAMACEVTWSRVLALVLGSSVYSFGMMVLVFLAGLSAGGALFTRLARGPRSPAAIFAASQVAATAALVAATLLVPRLPVLFLRGFPVTQASFGMLQAWNFALAALLLGPSAVLFGIAFPAAIAATSTSLTSLGRGVGRVTAANTLGTVAGAFGAGFALIPRFGLKTTLAAAAAATAAAGIAVLRLEAPGRKRRALGAAAAASFLLVLLLPQWPREILTMGVSFYAKSWANPEAFLAVARSREILFYKDGVNTTLSVSSAGPHRYYASNGKTDASSDPGDMANQIYLGQLPMLLHPNPRDVFVLGLGTGVSAAAVARYPVRAIEIVDIEPAARGAARLFEAENRNVLADPRVTLVSADGRNRLLSQPRTYDVIISDPSDVWVAGVGNLFTQEFYSLARARLNRGGLMVQWFHLHSLPPDQLKLIVATFRFVFPYTSLWRPNRGDIILVGSADRVVWNWPLLQSRFATVPGVSQDLLSIGIWDPIAVFAAYVCDGQELGALLRGVLRTHTDDRPVIEYLSPRAAYEDTTTANDRMITESQGHFLPFLTGFDEKKDLDARAAYLLGFGHAYLGRTASAIKIMEEAVRAEPQNARYLVGLGNQYRAGGSESKATGAYRKALDASPGESEAAQNLAAILRGQGDDAEAARVLRSCLAAAPDATGAALDLARLLLDLGRAAEALPLLEKPLEKDSAAGATQLLYGRALAAAGRGAEAVSFLRRARAALPDDEVAQRTAGELLLAVGDLDEATLAWARAVSLDPANVEGYIGLARVGAAPRRHRRRAGSHPPRQRNRPRQPPPRRALTRLRDSLFRQLKSGHAGRAGRTGPAAGHLGSVLRPAEPGRATETVVPDRRPYARTQGLRPASPLRPLLAAQSPDCEPGHRARLPEGGWRGRTRGNLTEAVLLGAPGLSGASD